MKLKRNSFVGGAGIYLFSNILNASIPFLLLPILTRYLSPAEYGEVAMFQTFLGLLGAFIGVAFVGAANRKYFDSGLAKKDLAEFIGSCVQLILIFAIIVFAVLFFFKKPVSVWMALQPKYILFAVIVSASTVVIALRLGQWQVQKKSIKYGSLQITQSLFSMLLSLLFVVVLLKGSDGHINAQIIISLLFLIIALILLKKDGLLKIFTWRKDFLAEALRFAVPLIPHLAGGFLLNSVDRFVINQEIGLAEAGVYMVAVQVTAAMGVIFDAINKAYVPWLFEKLKENNQKDKEGIVKLTYLWFLVIILGVLLAFLVGPWLVVFIAGEKYAQAGEVVGWLALGQGFQGMYLMVTNYIFFSKRTGMLSVASIGTGVLNLILLVFFVRLLGLQGAAMAFALSVGIRFILTWLIAHKRHPMPWLYILNS